MFTSPTRAFVRGDVNTCRAMAVEKAGKMLPKVKDEIFADSTDLATSSGRAQASSGTGCPAEHAAADEAGQLATQRYCHSSANRH